MDPEYWNALNHIAHCAPKYEIHQLSWGALYENWSRKHYSSRRDQGAGISNRVFHVWRCTQSYWTHESVEHRCTKILRISIQSKTWNYFGEVPKQFYFVCSADFENSVSLVDSAESVAYSVACKLYLIGNLQIVEMHILSSTCIVSIVVTLYGCFVHKKICIFLDSQTSVKALILPWLFFAENR